MTSEIKDHKINWDNSYIGEIDSLVIQSIEDKKYILVDLKYDINTVEKAVLYNFENFIPLICEDFKELFNLRKIGKHIVKYKHKHMLMVRFKNQGNLKDYLKFNNINPRTIPDYLKEDIRKCVAFRYIFSLKKINEKSLSIVFEKNITPYIINSFEDELNYKVKLSHRIVDDWFDDIEHFHSVVKSLIADRDVTMLKFQIQKIIEKYDKNLIGWTNVIYNRLLLESDII